MKVLRRVFISSAMCFLVLSSGTLQGFVGPSTPSNSRSIGIVLTGGGSFGAWETGALKALFDWWEAKYHTAPPIRIVAGTSTGALIAPFVLLGWSGGHDYLQDVMNLYTSFGPACIGPIGPNCLVNYSFNLVSAPTAVSFLLNQTVEPSVYVAGYPSLPLGAKLLWEHLADAVSDSMLVKIGSSWDTRRVGASSINFYTGQPWKVTNSPADMAKDGINLRLGILASAMAPLALPPAPVCDANPAPCKGKADEKDPFFDGGVFEEAPFKLLFELSASAPAVELTDVIVVSSFPWFPSCDAGPEAAKFPRLASFGQVGNRMNALMSEANATKATQLAAAAIQLRRLNVSQADVLKLTGYDISKVPTISGLFPLERQGWEAFAFDEGPSGKMAEMQNRGSKEAMDQLTGKNPPSPCKGALSPLGPPQ